MAKSEKSNVPPLTQEEAVDALNKLTGPEQVQVLEYIKSLQAVTKHDNQRNKVLAENS